MRTAGLDGSRANLTARAQPESIKELCRTCLSTERASRGFFLLRDEKIKKLGQTAGGKISQKHYI